MTSGPAPVTSDDITFRLLGRLEVLDRGRPVPVRAGKLLALLATSSVGHSAGGAEMSASNFLTRSDLAAPAAAMS